MSLIKCAECGKEISDKAGSCPHCGCPMSYTLKKLKEQERKLEEQENKDKLMYECPVCHVKYKNGVIECDVCGYRTIPSKTTGINISDNIMIKNNPEPNQIRCKYCNSTNVKKISGFSRIESVAMFGIFSKKIHKEFHCNNCGADF